MPRAPFTPTFGRTSMSCEQVGVLTDTAKSLSLV